MDNPPRHLRTDLFVNCEDCSLVSIWGGDPTEQHPHEKSGHDLQIMTVRDAIDMGGDQPIVELYNHHGYE